MNDHLSPDLSALGLETCGELIAYTDAQHIASFACFFPDEAIRERWPSLPETALHESGRLAFGRGLSAEQAKRSAFGEFVELASIAAWGDEPAEVSGTDVLSGADVPYPSARLYIPRDVPSQEDSALFQDMSVGCACGDTPDQAITAAVLELVEHDATVRWWYGKRLRPKLPLDMLPASIAGRVQSRLRRTHLLDITTNLAIPCVAAVSHDGDGRCLALGFSAKLTLEAAALSAFLEMLQSETALLTAQDANALSPDQAAWLEEASAQEGFLQGATIADPGKAGNAAATTESLSERFEALDIPLTLYDHTRSEFDIPVFRAIAPALCGNAATQDDLAHPRVLESDERDLGPSATDHNSVLLRI